MRPVFAVVVERGVHRVGTRLLDLVDDRAELGGARPGCRGSGRRSSGPWSCWPPTSPAR